MSPRHFLSGSRLFTRKKTFSVQYTICETRYRRESNNFITVRRSNNIRYILPSTLVMMRGWNETEENKEMGEEEKNITTSPSTTSRDVMKLVCGFFSRYLVYTWCDAVCGSPFPDSYAIVP